MREIESRCGKKIQEPEVTETNTRYEDPSSTLQDLSARIIAIRDSL